MSDESDEDMGEFVEVVTTYRCKFCSFQTTTTKQMAEHVKMIHKKSRGKDLASSTKEDNVHTNSVVIEEPSLLETVTATDEPQFGESYTDLPQLDENVVEETKVIQLSDLQALGNRQMIAISSNGQVLADNVQALSKPDQMMSYHFVSRSNLGQYSILQNSKENPFNMDGTIQVLVEDTGEVRDVSGEILDGSYQVETGESEALQQGDGIQLEVVQQTAMAAGENTEELTEISEAQPTHIIVEATELQTDLEQVKVETVGAGIDDDQELVQGEDQLEAMKTDEALTGVPENATTVTDSLTDPDVATKELFLCGNCSQGFASIQACKDHMIQDHGASDVIGSGKVDMGTQMEPRKKVGRKKNSEKDAEKQQKEADDEEILEIIASDSDEDWTEQLHNHEGRSRRKRQPPKILQSDYYLGRSKKRVRDETGLLLKCDVKGCMVKFRDEETLAFHKDCHIENAEKDAPQLKCPDCTEPATFHLWKQLRYHLWKIHKREVDILTCDICNVFKCDTMFKLKTHKEIHGTERPYTCDVCGKGFKQFAQMKNHQVIHYDRGVNTPAYMADRWHTPKVCDICGRTFANSKCLKNHKEQVHVTEKPFQCTFCSHTCSRKAMLALHLRSHTGEKPFRCDQCSYATGDHNSLRRHQYRHSGQKPYKCPHCPYASIQAISLKVHVKNKHPGLSGIYNCNLCLFRSVNKHQYDNHMLDHKHGLIKEVDNSALQKSIRPRRTKNQQPVVNNVQVMTSDVSIQPMPHLQTMQAVQATGVVPSGPVLQNINLPSGQVIQVPISGVQQQEGEHVTQLEMQVQMNEAGESVISAEDLAKLTNYDGLVHSDPAAAQLIYSALSAMSQSNQGQGEITATGQEVVTENGEIQTSIQTDNREGVTTHTITFHLPGEEIGGEVTLQNI